LAPTTIAPATVEPSTRPATSPETVPPPTTVVTSPATTLPATTLPVAVGALCGAPTNPFGYNFCGRGGLIRTPAAGTCSYFNCVAHFASSHGYMVECRDATYSLSGGPKDSVCAARGGELKVVYSGP